MTEKQYIAHRGSYIHRKVAGSDVLVSVGANVARFNGYIELNPAGALIWEALKEPKTLQQLADALCAEFGIDGETARVDAGDFLQELLENDMAAEA